MEQSENSLEVVDSRAAPLPFESTDLGPTAGRPPLIRCLQQHPRHAIFHPLLYLGENVLMTVSMHGGLMGSRRHRGFII